MTEKDKAKEQRADWDAAVKDHAKEHAEAVKKAKAPKPAPRSTKWLRRRTRPASGTTRM